jgi:2'-5' RNA ligase
VTGRALSGEPATRRRRLFVALAPDLVHREALAAAVTGLPHRGRAVPGRNLHLTLAFLGPLDPERASVAEAALAAVGGEPFTLELVRVGHFPRPRVLWCAAVAAPAALYALQGAVAGALAGAGFALERRPFTPHVTVVRKVARYRGPGALPTPVTWPLDAFCLVASRTLPGGAEYETVREYPLGGPSASGEPTAG